MYKYANSSLKEYIKNKDLMEKLADKLVDVHPEYKEIYDSFKDHWDEAILILDEEEARLFALSLEYSQKEIRFIYSKPISKGEISKRISAIYRKLALFYYQHEILYDEVV